MSVTHPSGSDLESMNEFYDKKILRAVTLVIDIDNVDERMPKIAHTYAQARFETRRGGCQRTRKQEQSR